MADIHGRVIRKRYIAYMSLLTVLLASGLILLFLLYPEVKRKAIQELNTRQIVHIKQAARGIETVFDDHVRMLESLSKSRHILFLDGTGRELMRHSHAANSKLINVIRRADSRGRVICRAFLQKPFSVHGLSREIREVLDG